MSEGNLNRVPNQQDYQESDGTLRPNNEALIAKRAEYIETAIADVLASKQEEILELPPIAFVTMVQDELREKDGSKDPAAFEKEFIENNAVIEQVFNHFGLSFNAGDSIDGVADALRAHYGQ